jgi:3-deoxy-D-manno-octulosonic-acid transferase
MARKILKGFTKIFVQNEDSKELLQFIGIENVEVSGDTRFDRVASIAGNPQPVEIAEVYASGHSVFIAGSIWPADEDMIFNLVKNNTHNLRFIIAPHEIKPEHLDSIMQKAGKKAVRFSQTNIDDVKKAEILIIDTIGQLSQLYQYGSMAYIGGGFGVGIHNILEAAAFGLPVFFGPNYQKFKEAKDLIELKGAFEINKPEELLTIVESLLSVKEKLSNASLLSKNYVSSNKGATSIILQRVNEVNQLRDITRVRTADCAIVAQIRLLLLHAESRLHQIYNLHRQHLPRFLRS